MKKMQKILIEPERSKLKKQHKQNRDKRICDRIKTVLAYDEGYSYTEISKFLLLDDETIRRYVKEYSDSQAIKPKHKGSQSLLSDSESAELRAHLNDKTYLRVKDIIAYIKAHFKKSYTVSGMTKWLHQQGFRYKKPQLAPAKADIALGLENARFWVRSLWLGWALRARSYRRMAKRERFKIAKEYQPEIAFSGQRAICLHKRNL